VIVSSAQILVELHEGLFVVDVRRDRHVTFLPRRLVELLRDARCQGTRTS
jgi:hypothetical protein